ncbi:hypothetical protein [Pseudooceanicola lipolyticus]|uniref:hypothetical protein n=1 Tax=Pseudooceanicola lipolyticus TaxID=2029104 RepID=UPI001054AEE6|nr:hypothetical protein [Pseudooceanicola lipolyticus]
MRGDLGRQLGLGKAGIACQLAGLAQMRRRIGQHRRRRLGKIRPRRGRYLAGAGPADHRAMFHRQRHRACKILAVPAVAQQHPAQTRRAQFGRGGAMFLGQPQRRAIGLQKADKTTVLTPA